MQAERQCTQLVEQHEAAQDWLREHVKCQGAPPEDRRGLHNAVNTLKALLQTVDREQREMKELDSSRDSLLSLCTPGGQDALTLEVRHLHDLCATSEREVRERLVACETRLEELDGQLARRAQGLKERAAALQWELRSLDQALGYSEPQNNIAQLQQHWHSLKNCENSLKDLDVKVNDLHQEVKSTPATDELPSEIMSLVKSLSQQHDSLKSRLSDHQETCSTNTARCLMDCLHALQEWNYSKPSESISSVQATLEEGEKLQASLREALSHQSFLTECLMPVLSEKLLSQGSETLRKADTHKASLNQSLKKLDGKSKQKLPDVLPGNQEETKTSVVAPPRKSKRSPEKKHQQKNIPSTEECTSIEDELSVSAELKIEAKTLKPAVTAVIEDITVAGAEQTRIELTKNKSQSPTNPSEPFTAQRFNTSEESLFKSIKPDTSAEPVGAEQIKPAVEESVLIQKVIEQSAPGVGEKTTPVPSRRKSKTLATDTEPSKTKVEPEMVKTIITQGSPRNPIGTAAVEETKRITTIVLDVSEPFTSAPVTTDTKSVTEQAETMVVEQAKLGPTSKESKSTDVSLKITVSKPAQIKSDAENLMSLQTSALITEADAGQPKSVRKGQESKTSKSSTTSEPVSEFKETKKEPEKGKTSSTAQGISQPVETAVKGESKLSPTKSKSPKLSPEFSNKEKTLTVEKSNSQMSLLRSKEQTEAAVVEEEAKVITTRRKSKSLVVSTVPEPVSAVERTTAVVKKPEKSSSSELAPAPTKTAVLEQSEVLPLKQKSTTPDQQAAQMTEEPESQRTAFSFREQKSKSAELTTTLQQIGADNITTNVEPEDNKKEPDCLKSSSTPQVVTEPTETTVVKEKKLSPTKRRPQSRKLSLEQATKEVAATMQEPESQKPTLSSREQNETFAVEETKVTPTRSKSKGIEVSTVPEPMSPLGRITVVEPKETKQEPENVQGQAKTAVVEQIKLPPPKRKSKSTESPLKLADTEAPQTKIETEDQTFCLSSNGQSKSIVKEEAKRVPTRRKSKNGDLSTTSETVVTHRSPDVEPERNKKELDGQMSSTPDVVMGKTESTAVGKAELLPTKEKSKSLKLSSELTKTKEEHDSQRPSSTPEVVTATTEVTVVEKGKLSPTKRRSKGIKISPDFASTDRTKTKEQPDSKKQSSTQELIPETTETTVVARGELSPTKTKLKELKLSPELATTELTKTKGEPHSQKPSLSLEVVTATTEITVVEKGELSPTNGKSKGLKRSPELATVELTRTKEEPDSQRPSSTPEVIKATTEVTVVEKGKLSPTKRKSKGLKPFTEPAFTGLSQTKDVPDSQIMDKQPHSELQGPKTRSKEATEEAITQSTSTAPQTQPPLSTEPSGLSDYIAKLWENTVEGQKRYLVLDLPEIGATQTCEIKPDQQEAEGVAISDSTQPNSAAFAVALPHKAETELSEISSPKQDLMKPSETVSQLRLTQERPKEKKDYDVQGEHYKVSTHDVYDAPKSLDENSVKKIHLEPEVHIIQLDLQASPDEGENTSFTRAKTMNPLQTSIQSERVPENKDMTAADVKPEKAAVKMTTIKVRESRAECQDNVTERDSAQPTPACEALPSDEAGTEFIEISISEQDMVKPSQTETQRGLFKTKKERPKPVKEHGVSEQYSTLLTHGMDNEPRSFEEKSERMEKLPMGTEVCILQLDIPTSPEKDEKTSVTRAKELRIDIVQTSIQSERLPENKDITTTDVKPEKAAVEMTKMKVQQSSTEHQDNVTQRGSAQLKPSGSETLQPHETELIEIRLYEQETVKPSHTDTKKEIMKTTQDRATEFKEHGVQEEHPKVSTPIMHDVPQSLHEKYLRMERIHMGPDVRILQLDLPTSLEKDANTSVTRAKEPRIDIVQTGIQRERTPENKDNTKSEKTTCKTQVEMQQITTERQDNVVDFAEVKPNEAEITSAGVRLSQQNPVKPSETVIKLELVKTTKERLTEVKDRNVQEVHAKVSKKHLHDAPQSPEEKSVKMSQELVTATTEITVVEKGELSPTKAKSLKLSPDLATKELAKAKEEPNSQKPSSTPQVVTSPTEITVVVKGELSPIERKSKDLQLSPDMAATELTKTKEEPHSQKPSSTQEVLTATTDTAIVEKGEFVPTKGKSKGLKLSPEVASTELMITKEEPDSQRPYSAPEVVTATTEITVVEKGELSPTKIKSKGLKISPELATMDMIKTKEEPDSQRPSSTPEMVTETTEITVVEKGKLSPSKKMTTDLKLSSEFPTKELIDVKKETDSQKSSVDSRESTECPILEEFTIPARRKPRRLDVSTAEEHVSAPGGSIDVEAKEEYNSVNVSTGQVCEADKISPPSLQAVVKSSTDIICGEVTLVEGLPSWDNKAQAEADVVKTEELLLEEPEAPEGSTTRNIFTQIQLLSGKGPSSQLIEGKPLEDAPEALITSSCDLDNRLRRLVSKVLSCKNYPAELNRTAMAQQLEEAQECREAAKAQVLLLSLLRGADAENKYALEHVEDQWSTAAQDAAAVVQSKEAQLQLVNDYCRQTQTAKTTLQRLTAELEAVRTSPEESSSKEAERLCSLQRSIEENRTVLGELLLTHTKLSPNLSWSERAAAQTEQNNLQEKWRGLERAVERTLYHTNVHSHNTSSLLSTISGLQEHLETIGKDLESSSVTQWTCKKAQQLMVANAEVKAAQQKSLHLQQLSEAFLLRSQREKDTTEIQQGLQRVKNKLCCTEELVSSQTQNSSSPIMEKIILVMRDGLAWAKTTESDIEGRRKRVALLPEEVHRQLRDLKKLQSEVMAKQGQLESLAEEVKELLPQLDQAEEVPMVHSSLKSLEELSKSTTEKLAKAVRELESGLQTREKLSEQIVDLDSWVLAHLHREASRSPDSELRSPTELDRRVRQIRETLALAEKQATVCEALLMKSKDITSELSITENCQLFDKLIDLQEDIRAISSYEKANKKEQEELTQTVDSSKKNLATIETSLRQMSGDLRRHRFPITSESLQALEPFKHVILEHKSQVDLLQRWIPREKTKELYSVISELLSNIVTLEMKARSHERYLNKRQCVEDLREHVEEQVRQTKDDSKALEDKYKICQTLLVQLPLIQYMSEEAGQELQVISADLYPSQLSAEGQRLKQNEGSLDTLEMTLYNNLSIIEWNLLKELDLDSERAATRAFLCKTQQELQKIPTLEPNEIVINNQYQMIMSLKKTVESRMRALEVLEQKKGNRQGSGSQDLIDLKIAVLNECDSQMENISQAKESLRSYTSAVRQAAQFLRDIEVSLLPPQGSAGLCSERLEETQQALASLQQQFQTHVEQLQSQDALHPYLSPQRVQQLQENILSHLLVRMSTLQAKGHMRLECLSSCAEHYRKYTKSQDEIIQSVQSAVSSLSQFISQKVTCHADCTDQHTKLRVLSEEVESLQRRLEEVKEWCPEQSCRGGREAAVAAVWKQVSRLRRCTQELTTRSERRIAEWIQITNSAKKASALLEQVEAEHPDGSRVKASTEDLQDLLQSWEQYQDRLDCEHRALSALELRAARLLGVPAHLEQAPPAPLCQQLQAMHGRYGSVKQRSREGLKAARMEVEERERVRKELQGVEVWLQAADALLSEMEQSSSTQELQEVHSQLCNQKALLQRIMESLKMKYSDMYTLVPVEIDGHMQEVTQSLQQVEVKVGEAVEMSGPVYRLGAKLSEIQAGLTSVQKRLEQRSPNMAQAKVTQKRAWDELDVWHSCVAAMEVDMQDLEKPEEVLILTERLVEVQELHSLLAKQAEQRTTLISKIHTWLQQHQEMISSSKSWMTEAKSWLATPCTYTTAKCLSSHVHTLQMVLDDSAQIRTTLQGFGSILKEMSQVCDVTTLQEQLDEADHQVAIVQDGFTAPLSHLGHAAAEVEAIESEVRRMESDVAEVKTLLLSPETFPSPREERLKVIEQKIQSMRRTIAEIQKCKPGLCLPEKAEETLVVFTVVDKLQTHLLELEKKVPALFFQQPATPVQSKAPSAQQKTSQPRLLKSALAEAEKKDVEQGQIRVVHVKEDILTGSGASLLTVERSSPEQTPGSTQRERPVGLQADGATERSGSQEQRVEGGGGGVWWWLWDAFLAASPEVPEETEGATGQSTGQTGEDRKDVEGPTEASSSEALSNPPGTVTTQSLPESMELMKGQRGLAWRGDDPEGLRTVYTQRAHTPAQNTLTKDSHTPSEGVTAVTAGGPESSEVDSGMRPILPTSGEVLVKPRSPLVTAAALHAYTTSQPHITPAERAEASEPAASPTCRFRLQHQDDAEGRRPAAASAPEEPRLGPRPREGVLHVCLQRVGQLELWLQEARRSPVAGGAAGSSAMQDNVEQQLLTCQEMFLEIEQRVSGLSAIGHPTDRQHDEAAELLSSKLELLKANLVSFQQLLQDRQGEERREPQEQTSAPHPERRSQLRRSSSVQEIFSSPRNKLLRQSSLQQQKELELGLTEQRGLTRAIARQGSRTPLHSRGAEHHGQLSSRSPPAEADAEEDSAQKKWAGLHSRLLAVEESWLLPPSEVTDSSTRHSDGTAGRMIGTQTMKELQTHISRLRELGIAATEPLDQASHVDSSRQTLDEGLFHVLSGTSLSLSSINSLLHSPAGTTHEGDTEWRLLQTLSAELATLGSELASQGSDVSRVLGSECARQCVDDLCRVLPVVRSALTSREKQLTNLQEELTKHQILPNELHAAFTSNQATGHQITNEFSGTLDLNKQLQALVDVQESLQQQVEQVSSLLEADRRHLPPSIIQQASQGEMDGSLGGVRSRCEELKTSVELQQQYERLVYSLQELLALGSERLAQRPDTELHSRAQLQQQLSGHTKFFQFLGHHFKILQQLTQRVPESALQRWEGVVTGLQDEVARLQQHGLEKGTRMQETIQVWSQWEEDSAWSDSLLRANEASFPKMHVGVNPEKQISEKLSLYQRGVLEGNKARFSRMLEAGLWLQVAGCGGVGVSTGELEARWRALQKKAELKRTNEERNRKLRSRFSRDSAVLADWMGGARELIDECSRLSVSAEEETDAEQRRDRYLQSVTLTKELEAKSELKVAVICVGTQLVELREEDQEPSDPGLCSVRSQLRQMELDWSGLLADVPVVQQALHKRWMKTMTQQGALLELQVWLEVAESRLEEHRSRVNRTSSTNADLSQLLKYCKEYLTEMLAHQATLDYVSQPLQTCSTEDGQRRRREHNQFAEEQGQLSHHWLSLQETLNSQLQEVEQELRSRVEREARLQQINSWITDQNLWMDSAQTPSSQTELQRSINTCQDLEEKIGQKSAALQELRDGLDGGGGEKSSSDFISRTDKSIQACAALTQQHDSVKQRLLQGQQLWDCVQKRLNQMMLKTARTSQTLDHHSSSPLCLQTHRDLHEKLQLLHEETEASETEWDELSQSASSLRDVVSPAAAALLTEQLDRQKDGWTAVSAALDQQLRRSRGVLQVWEVYGRLAASFSQRLQTLQSDVRSSLSGAAADEDTEEQLAGKMHSAQSLLERTGTLQSGLEEVLEASKDLISHLEPSAASLVQSESRLLSRGVQQLSQKGARMLGQLQEELERLQEFGDVLESLEGKLQQAEARPADQSGLLELSGPSADLDVLNEQSCTRTLGDAAARRLRRLNHRWADASARAEEACSELQTDALRQQSFQQKCESWMSFLQRMEDSLAVDVSGSYTGLRQQLCTHMRFQAELSTGHQILHSVITEALHLLQKGEVEDRSDFILKLAQLREHWQGAVQRADQRRSLVEGLVKHWHLYSRSLRKLQRFLSETQMLLPPAGPAHCSLQQLRRSLQDLQHTELLFQRYQCSFIHTLEVGRQLFSMGDEETQTRLQTDLGTLQEEWDNLHSLLGRRTELTEEIVKNWECCESGLADRTLQLKDLKTRLNQSMPEFDDELLSAEEYNKENEDSLEDWAESLTELSTMKTDLSQYIIADDILLLQEQVEHLNRQWEELCLKVSLRKQEIADRLNAWIIFNEKNKELCEWLTQMENKVAHNSDLNIEEMVEKLKKDCMEEINLFSENKTHLKQLGEQLITASNKTKETGVNDKLTDVNDRWQHLFDHIENRVRKLKETLVTVQQLDKNMSNLRTWLSRIEAELAKPVVYNVCHSDEIQRKLSEQQDLQRDIEQHTDSVASVLTLCDVLLHDADACGDSENDSIQQTTRSLDRRWRNICAMSMERRMRIEETWRLWCKFLDDFSRFEDWLKTSELTAANPDSADVLYTSAKEELKKFEAFQRQGHERLTQLELVNKQYRRLARENRTDAASKLKVLVHEGNQRWDSLQKRVASVLRRLKHFTSQREDFEGTREGILVWLTEMDLQLTNVEHFSVSDVEDKMRQLNGFQQEITLNTNKIDALIVFGENLIQKSAPLDAVLIEDELEELHSYCQEVFGRVARFHHRLVNRRPVLEEERELSDRDTDLDDAADLTNGTSSWEEARNEEEEEAPAVGGVSAGRQAVCHLLVPPLERSGRETPVSVDSIPLEWDHTVDVGGSSSHEDDEDDTYFSALSDVNVTESSESFVRATVGAATAASVKSLTDPPSWHQPGSPERKRVPREIIRGLNSSPTHTTSTPFHQQGYAKLMSECSGTINSVKRVKLILNDEGDLEDPGLTSSTADKQTSTGVIERWELLQVQQFSSETDIKQDLEQWQKLNSDLCDVTSWLGRVLPELERLQRIEPSTDIRDLELNIRKLKEMQKTFNSYKCLMISANLSSRHFLRGDSAELRELQDALGSANRSWTQACGGLESWERRLHSALMQCQEFHETLHSLLLWLAQAENKLSVVNVVDQSMPRSVLLQHRDMLTALQEELRGRQREVSSLQEISSQLLLEATGEDSLEAKEKVHVIGNKLHLLLRQVAADLSTLQGRLERCSASSEVDGIGLGALGSPLLLHKEAAGLQAATVGQPVTKREGRRDSSPRRSFFHRVLRAAFPLHLLFFTLLVLACLVPLSDEDYSCTLSNNFARSFYPMLRYTNGPPPT
ncbi:nesprin-2-like isoform X3 [Anarrhichthys ocellatus]|uniref:nesprin-2-like isoform X3 n=1 Tax=Anarrhichthys ocellatus TaxID=433405 RepID=UPI0012ED6E39|nr:nesprin-2-like isoform X3 [Anarrhichthys ocellatus]